MKTSSKLVRVSETLQQTGERVWTETLQQTGERVWNPPANWWEGLNTNIKLVRGSETSSNLVGGLKPPANWWEGLTPSSKLGRGRKPSSKLVRGRKPWSKLVRGLKPSSKLVKGSETLQQTLLTKALSTIKSSTYHVSLANFFLILKRAYQSSKFVIINWILSKNMTF